MEYKFKINEFEGPLDLLLHLIKEAEMDIMDIKIALLTDQYLAYLESMQNLNLQIASEYLVIAAELMYLKSKTLLPKEDDDLEESEEFILAKEDLVNRLLEYQKYKEVTSAFKFLEEKRGEFHTKAPSDITEYKSSEIRLNEDITLDDLVEAFKRYLIRKDYQKPLKTKVTTKELSIADRRKTIKRILADRKKVEFFELFEEFSKPYVVVTFLSILEMAKEKELVIRQENNFDKIYCEVA